MITILDLVIHIFNL